MGPRIGMGDLPPPPAVNRQVTPMVELIQQKECDIYYTVEQLKETKLFFGTTNLRKYTCKEKKKKEPCWQGGSISRIRTRASSYYDHKTACT